MKEYNLIAENPESTVVSEYTSVYQKRQSYQSESELENAFIQLLEQQAYSFLTVKKEADLIQNLRDQLETLNEFQFTDNEWQHFYKGKIASQNAGIEEKTTLIQEDFVQLLDRDDGTVKN